MTKEPPTSERSVAACARVKPRLIQALDAKNLQWGRPVLIRVFKSERVLEVWVRRDIRYALFKTYDICDFSGELGPKLREGDLQAPEGFYHVTPALMNPWSRFHLSFNIGYPNAYDRAHRRTGSYIMIHGNCVSTGCFAMTDPMIEEIYAMVDAALRNGRKKVPVHVFPFRPNKANLAKYEDHEWIDFWRNLADGYAYFEKHRAPPKVRVKQGTYVFQ